MDCSKGIWQHWELKEQLGALAGRSIGVPSGAVTHVPLGLGGLPFLYPPGKM